MARQSISGFRPEKLTEARQARALSQRALSVLTKNLSESAGVSNQQISNYENGTQAPSPETFEILCKVLKVPSELLLTPRTRDIDEASPIFYRKKRKAIQAEILRAEAKFKWLQDIYTYLWRFVEFPELNFPNISPPSNPEKIENEYIEEAASHLRDYWGVGNSPIANITRLVENNGIVVGSYDLNADAIDAFSQFQFQKPHIILGSHRKSACRHRFNLCHELGHLALHRNVPGLMLGSKAAFELMEDQAHRFAQAFLFPREAFFQEIRRADLGVFRLKKARWKISISAQIRRALSLGIISESEYSLMNRSMSRRKWRKFEPLDDEIPIEKPELLKDAFELVIEDEIQTKEQAVTSIKLNRIDIEELSNLKEGYLEETVFRLTPRSQLYKSRIEHPLNDNVISLDSARHQKDRL